MKKILIIQKVLPHYRVAFFKKLHDKLLEKNIELNLVYGQEEKGVVPKSIDITEAWAVKIKNIYINIFNSKIVWQPVISRIKEYDLIVVEHANSLLVNHLILAARIFLYRKKYFAYWGHGKNFNSKSNYSISEFIKKQTAKLCDWWFAYTLKTMKILQMLGVDKRIITNLNNVPDTDSIEKNLLIISDTELNSIKQKLNLNDAKTAIYCGAFVEYKKLDFLMESLDIVYEKNNNFKFIFIGAGPLEKKIREFSKIRPWVYYVGEKKGCDLLKYFLVSDILLMPGSTGLVLIECFYTKTPMLTTNINTHGPEIDYLDNNYNGLISDFEINEYSNMVNDCFNDIDSINKLKKGCGISAKKYTLDNMVENFSEGIDKLFAKAIN